MRLVPLALATAGAAAVQPATALTTTRMRRTDLVGRAVVEEPQPHHERDQA